MLPLPLSDALIGRVVCAGWPHPYEGVVYEVSAEAGVARLAYGPLGDHTYTPSFAAFLAGVVVVGILVGWL